MSDNSVEALRQEIEQLQSQNEELQRQNERLEGYRVETMKIFDEMREELNDDNLIAKFKTIEDSFEDKFPKAFAIIAVILGLVGFSSALIAAIIGEDKQRSVILETVDAAVEKKVQSALDEAISKNQDWLEETEIMRRIQSIQDSTLGLRQAINPQKPEEVLTISRLNDSISVLNERMVNLREANNRDVSRLSETFDNNFNNIILLNTALLTFVGGLIIAQISGGFPFFNRKRKMGKLTEDLEHITGKGQPTPQDDRDPAA